MIEKLKGGYKMLRSEKEKEKFNIIKCPKCNSIVFKQVFRNVLSFGFTCECGHTFKESHNNVTIF